MRAGFGGGENPSAAPPADPADELSPFFKKLGLSGAEPGRCGACGAIVKADESPCPKCGADLEW